MRTRGVHAHGDLPKFSGRLPSLEMYPRRVVSALQSVVVGRMTNGRQRKRKHGRRQVENVADVLDSAFNGIDAKPHGAQPHGLGLDQDILGCGGASRTQNPGCF